MLEKLFELNTKTYINADPLILEAGGIIQNLSIHYTTYGKLNPDKSNVVWVFHALTGNSAPMEWWDGIVGCDCPINPNKYFVVCANMLGSCYGSTEPTDFNFPLITIADQVKCFQLLKEHLKLDRIKIGIGGSMGGQQLLEWAVQEPSVFETIIPIATNVRHSPWGIAFNETQRMAIRLDEKRGTEVARAIAMLSYRSYEVYDETQKDFDAKSDAFLASSYQNYQGQKLAKRFTSFSYYVLSKAMDSHNIGRHFNGIKAALDRIDSTVLAIGVDTDILFPTREQRLIAEKTRNGAYHEISSIYGHDGFLVEKEQINKILSIF